MIRGQQKQFRLTEGKLVLAQVQETDVPDLQYFDYKPILGAAEEIFNLVMAEVKQIGRGSEEMKVTATTEGAKLQQYDGSTLFKDIPRVINCLCLSIEAAYSNGEDDHSKTISILNMLSSFSWEAKLVLSLLALAFNLGESVLLTKIYLSDELPDKMAVLKGIQVFREQPYILRSKFVNLSNPSASLITSVLDIAKCILEFSELSSLFDAGEASPVAVKSATYWAIRGVLALASVIAEVNTKGSEAFPTTEYWELSTYGHKLGKLKIQIQNQLEVLRKNIEEKKQKDAYDQLVRITGVRHQDNLVVLRALLCAKEDELPLYDAPNKTMVNLDVLKKKTVLLMISALDIADDPYLLLLHHVYDESRTKETSEENRYEVVWIPILDPPDKWTTETETMLESHRTMMPWYSMNHPNMIDPTVVKLIKEKFHYRDQPVVVVLDRNGMVVNTDAIDMIWLWEDRAFPFSQEKEEALWKGESLGLELIADGFLHDIENWEGKYIILYGGDNVEWIRKFVTTTNQVRNATNIPLEMIYVGRNNQTGQEMSKLIELFKNEELGHLLSGINLIWYFWTRLERMKRSKIRLGSSSSSSSSTVREDPILQGITKLLSHDQSGRWASMFKGNEVVVTGHGDAMLLTMERYFDEWKDDAKKGFDVAFKEYFESPQVDIVHTLRVTLPSNFEGMVDMITCSECNHKMEKHMLFLCSHGKE